MGKTVNKATVLGNVGRDPEIKTTSGGTLIATFSIATSYKAKDRDEKTEWHNITAFGRTAEIIRDYVKKGSKIYVEGRLDTQTWEKDGHKNYRTSIIVDELTLLGDSGGGGGQRSAPARQQQQQAEIADDDIPF
jgi:single-strand DNA-binding protein